MEANCGDIPCGLVMRSVWIFDAISGMNLADERRWEMWEKKSIYLQGRSRRKLAEEAVFAVRSFLPGGFSCSYSQSEPHHDAPEVRAGGARGAITGDSHRPHHSFRLTIPFSPSNVPSYSHS